MSARGWMRRAGVSAAVLLTMLWAAPAASAAPAAPAQSGVMGLEEWSQQVTDSSGVPISKYEALPLDHGAGGIDINPARDALVSVLDFFWGLHYMCVTTCMWLLHTLLSFQWVSWFSGPMEVLGQNFGQLVAQIHWIPLAAMISGTTIGLLFFMRKRGAAWGEMFVSVMMVVVATNIALNPVAYITGPDGVLQTSQQTAAQIAVEATGGKGAMDGGADASSALGQSVMADLTDAMLRGPSQAVAFGQLLEGGCASTFTETMKAADPMDVKSKSVMDPVKGCSESAKSWSESTSFIKVAPMLMTNLGSAAFAVLVATMAVVLFLAVLTALFYGVYQVLAVMISIVPGTSRKEFFGAFVGVIACGVVIVAAIVLVAVSLRLVANMLLATAALGVTLQMLLLVLMLIALIWLVLRVRHGIMKKGDQTARWLSRLGAGQEKKSSVPMKSLVGMAGTALGGYKFGRLGLAKGGGQDGPARSRPTGGGAGPSGGSDTPSGGPRRPDPRGPQVFGRAARADGGSGPARRRRPGGQLPPAPLVRAVGVGAAAIGGPMGGAVNVVAQGAAWSIERQNRKELTGPGKPQRVPRQSRITVGSDGKATVTPRRPEVVEGTVVDSSQGPQQPPRRPRAHSTEATQRMRERLRAAQGPRGQHA